MTRDAWDLTEADGCEIHRPHHVTGEGKDGAVFSGLVGIGLFEGDEFEAPDRFHAHQVGEGT